MGKRKILAASQNYSISQTLRWLQECKNMLVRLFLIPSNIEKNAVFLCSYSILILNLFFIPLHLFEIL